MFFFKLCYLDVSKKFELIELYFFYKFLKITGFRYSGLLKKFDLDLSENFKSSYI